VEKNEILNKAGEVVIIDDRKSPKPRKALKGVRKQAKKVKNVETSTKKVANSTKPAKINTKSSKKEENMNHTKARKMAKEVLAEVAKANAKTHHIGRDGNWLINSKTGEVQVGISKKGGTGLVKVTMPLGVLPREVAEHGKKAAQAFHMTWLQFDISRNSLKKAILARIKNNKTMYEFAEDVYGTKDAPCWNKVSSVKKSVEDKLKDIKTKRAKIADEEKALKAEIKNRKAKKGAKVVKGIKTAPATV